MIKFFASLFLAIASVGAALATSFTGSFSWVAGTLNAPVTAGHAPQTISLKVGSSNFTYPNVYVAGTATYPTSTPFTLLLANSRPMAASFTSNSVVVLPNDASGVSARDSVPMTSSGFISNSIGFDSQYAPDLRLFYPPCTLGSLNFSAGILVTVANGIMNYNVALPAPGTPTVGTAVFSPSIPAPYTFNFTASGNGTFTVIGSGNVSNLTIAAASLGVATHFTTGSLSIGVIPIF